jgi:hypothetical protein
MTSLILDQVRPFGKVTEGYSQSAQRGRQKKGEATAEQM